MSRQLSLLKGFFAILLLVIALAGLTWMNYRFSIQNPGGGDFLARWGGARAFLVDGLNPYSERVSLEIQEMYYGRPALPDEDKVYFVYPLYSLVFFGPFALVGSYPLARALWMTLIEAALIALVFIGVRTAKWRVGIVTMAFLLLFSLLWYHGFRNIMLGQFAGLNAVLIILPLILIHQNDDTAAGILLALSTIKPQMVYLFVPLVLIWALSKRRFRLIIATLVSFGALIVISLALIPSWPLDMIHQVLEYPGYTTIGSPLSIIANFVPGVGVTLNQVLHIIAYLYLIVEWVLVWDKDEGWFTWTALLTLVITNLVALRTATTHYVVLLPVLFFIFRIWEQRWKTAGRIGVWVVLFLLFAGLWALFLTTVQGNVESEWMYLPVPFFCLIGLWWVRWWAIHQGQLMVEEFTSRIG